MSTRKTYNCQKCPGYCCSYPLIALTKRDVERLAKHFNLSFKVAKAKFTCERYGHKYSMRRKKDEHFGGHLPLLRYGKALLHRSTPHGRPPAAAIRATVAAITISCRSSAPRRRTRSSSPPPGISKHTYARRGRFRWPWDRWVCSPVRRGEDHQRSQQQHRIDCVRIFPLPASGASKTSMKVRTPSLVRLPYRALS